jgi:hypothetical protein
MTSAAATTLPSNKGGTEFRSMMPTARSLLISVAACLFSGLYAGKEEEWVSVDEGSAFRPWNPGYKLAPGIGHALSPKR